MTSVAKALKKFYSGFGLPAYDTTTVPDDVSVPYITYTIAEPEWNQKASIHAQVWDRSKSNARILQYADAIVRDIGSGRMLNVPEGTFVIWPETPLIQVMHDAEEDGKPSDYRYAYINLSINAYHMPGD